MYGQIRQGIIYKRCKLCKILPAVLQVEPANAIMSHPFLNNWDGYLSVASFFYRSAIMPFKCIPGCGPEYLSSQFIKRTEVSNRRTRNSRKLNIPLFKTASAQTTFYNRTASLWNSLDPSFKLCWNVKLLKQSLRSKLLQELYET